MAFFTLARPFETHPPQVKGSVVLFRDKLGNLIVCEPEPVSSSGNGTTARASIPSTSTEEIKTIDTTINTAALQQYTIFEGTDGNKYLSPNVGLNLGHQQSPCIQMIQSSPFDGQLEDEDEEFDPPPYQLDHMYARKPVKPGEEERKPARRRASKNSIKSEINIQEAVDDGIEVQTPDVTMGHNFSQALIVSSFPRAIVSCPRILNVPEKLNGTKVAVAGGSPCSWESPQRKTKPNRNSDSSIQQHPGNDFPPVATYVTVATDDGQSSSRTLYAPSGTIYQNGTNLIEDMGTCSGSTTFLEEGSVASENSESQRDSTQHFHFIEDVHEVVV